jgi:hypothetical protein
MVLSARRVFLHACTVFSSNDIIFEDNFNGAQCTVFTIVTGGLG